jgi:hypothetical protein
MSSVQEKVKDLVEVCSFKSPVDFHSDPSMTADAYRFTDVTANLMAGWLDAVGFGADSGGVCRALAGFRGVGKSHFIALFGAIIGNPELRAKVDDSHVAASAGSLPRRRYPVANVLRGTRESLFEELRAAVAVTMGLSPGSVPDDLQDLLAAANEKAGDMPFVILVDTAFDRKARVSRDDGHFLSELATAARSFGMFLAVALDDDITDADGSNAAIVQHFAIDYLEQEHLYKIVDAHIFRKNRLKRDIVGKAYSFFKKVIPEFRWSDRRFNSLYPLHPLILEIAPVVRLYAPDFALLSFASEAGKRIMGRPYRSLIGLDEVFDSVENTLRKHENLKDAFTVYDKISEQIPSLVPVFERLQAKLILKALFVLSLDGEGVTAGEIAAAILIYEEDDPNAAVEKVSGLVEKFASVFPEDLWRVEGHSGEVRYSLKVSGKDNLNHALAAAIASVPDSVVQVVLKKAGRERYSDWSLGAGGEDPDSNCVDVETVWRGSIRKIRFFWNWRNEGIDSLRMLSGGEDPDLYLLVNGPGAIPEDASSDNDPVICWKPSELLPAEVESVKRYYLLVNDAEIRGEFQEQLGAAGHSLGVAVEKIWKRAFLKDAKFTVAGRDLPIESGIESLSNFSGLLSRLAEPVLEELYPEHPEFDHTLGMREVSLLVSDLFSGARIGQQIVQNLASTFALPLGLVTTQNEEYVLEKEEELFGLHLVEKVLSLVGKSGDETVSLESVYKRLREKPYGLAKESQHLILSALVARGKIEFVTDKGDRINRRSLDLRIIWDDIAGISKPEDVVYGSQRLSQWAKTLTGVSQIQSIDLSDDRSKVKSAISKWVDDWQKEAILETFSELHSDQLNTKIWYTVLNVEKTFGAVDVSFRAFLDDSLSLEEALQRAADAFSDSEEEFELRNQDLLTVANFTRGAALRESVEGYLALCEMTDNEEIELLRERLDDLCGKSMEAPSVANNVDLESTFEEFRESFASHFVDAHDSVMKSDDLSRRTDEILSSDEWWEFEALSSLPIFRRFHHEKAASLVNQLRSLKCKRRVLEEVKAQPFCGCGFRLNDAKQVALLPKELIATVLQGSGSYRRTLSLAADVLEPLIDNCSAVNESQAAESLKGKLRARGDSAPMTSEELIILKEACGLIENSPVIDVSYPEISDFLTASELGERLKSWVSELPDEPLFISI